MRDEVADTAEGRRLTHSSSDDSAWRRWGRYSSARQWGTVREDYTTTAMPGTPSPSTTPTYRWGEDGLGGRSDRYGFLNLAVALWNTHGDRLKEYYGSLDATPTHSGGQWRYRYPQAGDRARRPQPAVGRGHRTAIV
ncbi:MAG TPA: hypothetical protein H9987_06025 [Candidatus Luteococcus avicola]|nr:hypothetical protein [Candidatus Luteococcus avicola]